MSAAQRDLEPGSSPAPTTRRRTKRSVRTIQDMAIIRSLIGLRLRPPLVASVVQIPVCDARALWRHMHKKSPPSGGLAWKAVSRIRTAKAAAHAMAFYVLYLRCARQNEVAARQFSIHAAERAYRLYCSLVVTPPLEFTNCFLVARDAALGLLQERTCPRCQQPFFQQIDYPAWRHCPWCAPVNRINVRKSHVIHRPHHATVE